MALLRNASPEARRAARPHPPERSHGAFAAPQAVSVVHGAGRLLCHPVPARARVVGALLASTASLAAAGPAKASVAPFSDDLSRTQRKLTGYVMDDSSIRTAVAAWFADRSGAETTYGHISTWATGGVTDMAFLFCVRERWMDGYSS